MLERANGVAGSHAAVPGAADVVGRIFLDRRFGRLVGGVAAEFHFDLLVGDQVAAFQHGAVGAVDFGVDVRIRGLDFGLGRSVHAFEQVGGFGVCGDCVGIGVGNRVNGDFHVRSLRQPANFHQLPCRLVFAEEPGTDPVDHIVFVDFVKVNAHTRDVFFLHASGLENGANVVEGGLGLLFNALEKRARFEIDTELAGNCQRVRTVREQGKQTLRVVPDRCGRTIGFNLNLCYEL